MVISTLSLQFSMQTSQVKAGNSLATRLSSMKLPAFGISMAVKLLRLRVKSSPTMSLR